MAVAAGSILTDLSVGLVDLTPRLVSAIVVAVIGVILIKVVTMSLRGAAVRAGREEDVARLAGIVVGLFLYYSLALAVIAILGLTDLAASLGSAVGFIGLGVAYALKDVIADVVAGVYLMRDPDFAAGDSVVTGDGEGVVVDVGIRKARIDTAEGDRLVVSNSSVDKKWTRKGPGGGGEGPS